MRKFYTVKILIALFVLAFPLAIYAQTNGNKTDIVNKTWRFVGMKCPEGMSGSSTDNDEYVKYFMSLHLFPAIYDDINHGKYVRVYRDQRDNPREDGVYSLVTDEENGTKLILSSKRGGVQEYRVETIYPNHLTLIELDNSEKCRVSYAIAP